MVTIDRDALVGFLAGLNAVNWGMWPDPAEWPAFGESYTCSNYTTAAGQTATVVKFDRRVRVADAVDKRFAVGRGLRHLGFSVTPLR